MSYLQKVRDEFARTGYRDLSLRSVAWFRDRLRNARPNRNSLLNDQRVTTVTEPGPGDMYMYFYDPKHKEKLPYYDRFPLTIMIGPDGNGTGFHGLNLHYLYYDVRAAFLDDLVSMASETGRLSAGNRFAVTYNRLKNTANLREFRPCYKHYLFNHIRSPMARVEPEDWEMVIFLPISQFAKQSNRHVWRKSLQQI